jgi:SNF2 family DNA or RNA helicase
VIVFGLHTEALRWVAHHLQHWKARLLIGDTPHAQRQDAIRAFAADDTQVLVANMKIAGHGLNLQVARRVIFLEADWTPGPNDQAIGRLFRPGQRRPVHATFIGVARSSDMRVAQVVARKRRIITEIIGTGGE